MTDGPTMLDAEKRDEQVARLFSVIFDPGDLVEVRTGKAGVSDWPKDWLTWTGEVDSVSGMLDLVEPRIKRDGHGVYFGANPRRERGGKAEHVARARCLFVDFDTSADGSPGCSREDALRRVEDAVLPWPSAVVESGGGVHCYWRLAEPLTDLPRWTSIQKALISRLRTDRVVHDPPRIMRLPGMLNAKRGRLALLVDASDLRVYELDEFSAVIEEAERKDAETKERVSRVEVKPGGMSDMTRSLIKDGVLLNGGGRRQSLFTAACDLQAHGWSEQDAVALLLPVGQRLGLDGAEVEDLRRQFRNAFGKDRQPYAFDRQKQDPEERREERLPTLDEQLQAFKAFRSRNAGRRFVGLQTGFDRLDELLSGLSGLTVFAAAPGAGKTSMSLQLGLQTLHRNPDCCFVFMSCEMMTREIAGRLLTMRTSLDLRRLSLPGLTRDGRIVPDIGRADDEVIEKAIKDLQEVSSRIRLVPPGLIIEAGSRGDLADWMQRRTIEVMDETGTSEVVVVLDNINQAPFASTRHDGTFGSDIERDRFAIESMMRLQHELAARATRCATVVVSEVSKGAMKEGSVDMTAVIGSIRSIYKADGVWIMAQAERGKGAKSVNLFAPRSSDPTAADFDRRCIDLVIQKARAPGEKGRLLLAFDHRLHRMEEMVEETAVRVGEEEVEA